jgi:hypothetical protein
MVEIQPLQIEIEREEDGRFLASVPELPGVMAYGNRRVGAAEGEGNCAPGARR